MDQEDQTPVENTENITPAELSPVEQEAVAQGWVPKEEFQGPEYKWVDAAEFLRRGELFAKIEDQSRTIKDLRKTINDFKNFREEIRETEYKRALQELKSQKRAALAEGDADLVMELDEKIDLVKEEQQTLKAQQSAPEAPVSNEPNPQFVAWVNRNSWYTSNKAMKAFADSIGTELAASGMSPSEVLAKVEQEVKKEFKHKFENPRRDNPSGVEGSTGKGSDTKSDKVDLTDEERQVMNRFVRSGLMTKEEFMKDLKAVKERNA